MEDLEQLLSIIEERDRELEKKDELIFGLFEQVDQLKDNVEVLQLVSITITNFIQNLIITEKKEC